MMEIFAEAMVCILKYIKDDRLQSFSISLFLAKNWLTDDLLDTPKFKLYNHYRCRTVVFETPTSV